MIMTKMTNLEDYKKIRKIKRVVKELSEIERLLSLVLKGLATYKKYTPIRDILTNVLDNKALVNVYLKKYKGALEKINETNKLE